MSFKDKLKKVTSEIKSRYKYMRGQKGVLESDYEKIKHWQPDDEFAKADKEHALAEIDLVWFLFCLMKFAAKDAKTILFDNDFIKKWEENKKNIKTNKDDSGVKKFFKNLQKSHPRAAATLQLWMVYALMTLGIAGGKVAYDNKDYIKEFVKEWRTKPQPKPSQEVFKDIHVIKINPNVSKEEWKEQMDAIWPYLYMETILSEGFVDEAYADVGDFSGYITIGSGFMIGKANPRGKKDRAVIQERKAFFKKVLGKPYVNGVKISYEENRILIRAFYEKYVWPFIKKNFTRPMDVHLFIELCIGNFNRGSGIYNDKYAGARIKNLVNNGAEITTIVNCFDDFCKDGFGGLLPKYGIAAHRAQGDVSDEDVLNSLANSVYKLSANKMWEKGQLKKYKNIREDLQSISNADVHKNGKTYVQHKLCEYLTPDEVKKISNGKLFGSKTEVVQTLPVYQETTAEKLNEQGEALLDAGDYLGAIDKFNQAVYKNPYMYIVYSNLSLTYYKLGKYESGIKVVKDFINSKYFDEAPVAVKGYAYYNAALCYERLGDKESNKTKKIEYYERAKKNAELGEIVAKTKYFAFIKRIERKLAVPSKTKSKKMAFDDGIMKIKAKQSKQGNIIYPFDNEYLA